MFAGRRALALFLCCGPLMPDRVAAAHAGALLAAQQDLTPILEGIRRKHDLPAMAGAVVMGDRIVAQGVCGERKRRTGVPPEPDDVWHLGSCTKAMTATLIALLVEKGQLRWDTTLADVFPHLSATMHEEYRRVTIRQLLAHRSGLPQEQPADVSVTELRELPGAPREQRGAFVGMRLVGPPLSSPGSTFQYSNAGYIILGAVAEQVADMPYETLMGDLLFRPLGMKTACFAAATSETEIEQPWQHPVVWNGMPVAVPPTAENDLPPVYYPAGGVHCSVGDWAKFITMHLRDEREEGGLLKPETIKALHTSQYGDDYAMGWLITERTWGGGEVLYHGGSQNMNYAVVWMAPKKDFAVLVTSNQGGDVAVNACDEVAGNLIGRYLIESK
jgi:CubicO group peptidase (beta-lactamase class C family)